MCIALRWSIQGTTVVEVGFDRPDFFVEKYCIEKNSVPYLRKSTITYIVILRRGDKEAVV